MSSGAPKTKNVTSSSTSQPWAPVQPGLKQGISDLGSLYNSGQFLKANTPSYPSVADLAPETTQSWNAIASRANAGSPDLQGAQAWNRNILSGDISQGPLSNIANDAADRIAGQFSMSGRLGANNAYARGLGGGIASAVLPYQQAAAQFAPTLAQADYADAGMLGQVGGQRQAYAQDLLNAYNTQQDALKQAPISAVTDYMNALSGNWGGATTQNQPVQYQSQSPWATGAGLGLGLLGAFMQTPGA